MEKRFTESELVSFLEYAANKGLLNGNTAQGRRVATLKVLQALDDHEKADLRNIDRDATFARFVNRFGKDFNPASLQVYRSRFNASLNDFLRYQEDPTTFRSSATSRTSRTNGDKSSASQPRRASQRPVSVKSEPTKAISQAPYAGQAIVFPIPLRPGLTVQIHNLPMDLTRSEAARIAGVVNALAIHEEKTERKA